MKRRDELQKKTGEEIIKHFQDDKTNKKVKKKKKKKVQKRDDNLLDESLELNEEFNINTIKKKKEEFEDNECELSLYLFTKRNKFRRFLYWLSNHSGFELVI